MLNTHFNLRGLLGQLGGLMALVILVCMETNRSTEGRGCYLCHGAGNIQEKQVPCLLMI